MLQVNTQAGAAGGAERETESQGVGREVPSDRTRR